MAGEAKKSEGPSCACGKVDLYDEWLKQNANKNETDPELTSTKSTDDHVINSNEAFTVDQTPVQTKE
jgi:hypothetical protein